MDKYCDAQIGDRSLKVKILSTPLERSIGYQGRKTEPKFGEGLLFYFISEQPHFFHMKNVNFDLDLLGFNRTGKMVCKIPMTSESEKNYETPPCKFVIEVPKGWADGLKAGNCYLKLSKT